MPTTIGGADDTMLKVDGIDVGGDGTPPTPDVLNQWRTRFAVANVYAAHALR